jgi:hypothetical protein
MATDRIEYIICPCGLKIEESSEMNEDEERDHNCPSGCCGAKYKCECGNEIIISLAAPDC